MLGVLHPERDRHPHRQIAVEIEAGPVCHAERRGRPIVRTLVHVARTRHLPEHVDRIPPVLVTDRLHLGGDHIESFLPRRLAELAAAPLSFTDQRRQHAVLVVDLQVVAQPFHAPARRIDAVGIVGCLLDLDDLAVADERQLATRTRAVRRTRRAHHTIDRQRQLGRRADLRIRQHHRRRRSRRGPDATRDQRTSREPSALRRTDLSRRFGLRPRRARPDRYSVIVHRRTTDGISGQESIVCSLDPHAPQRVELVPSAPGRSNGAARRAAPARRANQPTTGTAARPASTLRRVAVVPPEPSNLDREVMNSTIPDPANTEQGRTSRTGAARIDPRGSAGPWSWPPGPMCPVTDARNP